MTAADHDPTTREARDAFLARFGLDLEGYAAPDFPVHLGPFLTLRFPNPGLLPYHDLHHVATGYPATVLGEAEISAFELRAGCRVPLIVLLCCGAALIGLLRAPRRIARAWRRGRGARVIYGTRAPYEELLNLRVSELRRLMNLPDEACATVAEGKEAAWDRRVSYRPLR